jgi:hypothetical protein
MTHTADYDCDKWQTSPLVREGAPHRQTRNFPTVPKIWSWAPDGARRTDWLTDCRSWRDFDKHCLVIEIISNGPNRVGVSPLLHLRTITDPVSEMCFLALWEYGTMDKVQKPCNSIHGEFGSRRNFKRNVITFKWWFNDLRQYLTIAHL